jgi:hypothetical protein
VPVLDVDVRDRVVGSDEPCVVDQDVDPAVGLEHFCREGLPTILFGDVEAPPLDGPVSLAVRRGYVGSVDGRTLCGQRHCCGVADAAGRAGDDGDVSVKGW